MSIGTPTLVTLELTRSTYSTCSRHVATGVLERRREAEHQLQDYVECEARDLSGEPFTRFMNQIYKRIYALISRCAS